MDYQKIKDFRNANNPYCQQLGIFVEEIGPGYAQVTKTVGPEDVNPLGVPHGGVYFSMADTAGGSAMASHGYMAVTVNCNYNFMRSARVGDTLTAKAREIKAGKTLCVYDVRITDQEGTLLGTGTFTFYLLNQNLEIVEPAASV